MFHKPGFSFKIHAAVRSILLAGFLLLAGSGTIMAQDTLMITPPNAQVDSTVSKHSPRKAAILSAVLPGLGQAYNKKYWKIPVVYAGFGVLGYFIQDNYRYYWVFSEAFKLRDKYPYSRIIHDKIRNPNYTAEQLLQGRDFYRRNFEVSLIYTAAWYGLQIIDATVDAHFFDYDVNEDISLKWEPLLFHEPHLSLSSGAGIKLTVQLK